MTRDHLMGYPAAAAVSADCPDEYDDFPDFDHSDYPLGVPRRVRIDMRKRWDAAGLKTDTLGTFERMPHPNPDGSYTPKRPGTLFGKAPTGSVLDDFLTKGTSPPGVGLGALQLHATSYEVTEIHADGPVVQSADYAYSEEAGQFEIADWRSVPARMAIPLSALVPAGLMVDSGERLRIGANGAIRHGEKLRKAFDQCAPGSRAQVLIGNVLQSMQDRAQLAPQPPRQKVVASDALALALHRMNNDPEYRERMAKRITAVNEQLKAQGPSKGDGGIALPELDGIKDARFTACSIPIRIETLNPKRYGPEFDFPPNA